MQISGYLYITNGTDNLARYNGSVLSTYNSILAPTGLAGARTGLSDGTVSEYAEVTAVNEIGETVGSTEAILTINKPRDQWTTGEKITWTWNTVSGGFFLPNLYFWSPGNETLLASATNPSYIDDGTVAINLCRTSFVEYDGGSKV